MMANRRNNYGTRKRPPKAERERLTLDQYLALVDAGLDGDKIKDWSKQHAEREIQRRGLLADQGEGAT